MLNHSKKTDVLIVGAGVSGLAAADRLAAAGWHVQIIEKSRGVSGRVSTRRWDDLRVDHGAQFFTVRTRDFETRVGQWLDAGVCFRWSKGFHRYVDGRLEPPNAAEAFPRYACREGMSALGKAMAKGLVIHQETKASRILRRGERWVVECEEGVFYDADFILLSPPAPQSLALLDHSIKLAEPIFSESLSSVRYAPCLCVAAEYEQTEPEWKGVQFAADTVLSWVGNDTSRRGQAAYHTGKVVIILHAGGEFSERWQDTNLDEAASRILSRGAETLGSWLAKPLRYFVHRWRFAHVAHGYSETPFLKTQSTPPAYAIGDAFMGARVEGAYLSGLAAANDLLVHHG